MSRCKTNDLVVRGARTHNLKSIDVRIPMGQLTVVTGPSGSGKSSLAFDTLFAEGQRRFVESMSTYARQFIQQMPRPDVDGIENVLPAIALEQKNTVRNARSTVGTATEIHDFLSLIFGRIGRVFCPDCQCEAQAFSPESATNLLVSLSDASMRVIITAPVDRPPKWSAKAAETLKAHWLSQGWGRAWLNGSTENLEFLTGKDLVKAETLEVVTDRLTVDPPQGGRLTEALEVAFALGHGRAAAHESNGAVHRFSRDLACGQCGRVFEPPSPSQFSFYSPMGACPTCQGFGRVMGIDWDKVIPNPERSMAEGAIHPWNSPSNREMYDWFREVLGDQAFPWDTPFRELESPYRDWVLQGYQKFWGVAGFFDYLERKKYKIQNRVMLARYRAYIPCGDCLGTRLREPGRWARVGGYGITELLNMPIRDLAPVIDSLKLNPRERETVDLALRELKSRLIYLNEVGLGYLTSSRQTRTLSGGESQRINLATALGSDLTGTLYVLDEPTVGLHGRDTTRLLKVLQRLKHVGNTVVVVEHDPLVMEGADYMIDLGPGAGEHGGTLVYSGTAQGIMKEKDSLTGDFLRKRRVFSAKARSAKGHGEEAMIPARPSRSAKGWIRVIGARENNLANIDVAFPLGTLCCLTGVSGSGKSSLLKSILYGAYARRQGNATVDVGAHDRIEGLDGVGDILLVDQTPLGRSARSNPVTYVKAYDPIRKLFAEAAAVAGRGRKMTPSHFSFNSKEGRCPVCNGIGTVEVDMHFLADVEMTCDACQGKRFLPRTLAVDYRGRSIADVLAMTVDGAATFFAEHPKIVRALQPLHDVGLGYLRLGQNSSTLSGGEAQRLKLAGVLAGKRIREKTLLIFDEPTTGLHPSDIDVLLHALERLIDEGAGAIVVEHNLDFIIRADHVIDLGPEGGDEGGRIVFEGTVADLIQNKHSHTAACLRAYWKR